MNNKWTYEMRHNTSVHKFQWNNDLAVEPASYHLEIGWCIPSSFSGSLQEVCLMDQMNCGFHLLQWILPPPDGVIKTQNSMTLSMGEFFGWGHENKSCGLIHILWIGGVWYKIINSGHTMEEVQIFQHILLYSSYLCAAPWHRTSFWTNAVLLIV